VRGLISLILLISSIFSGQANTAYARSVGAMPMPPATPMPAIQHTIGPSRIDAQAVSIRIESSERAYRAGEPIQLRIHATNNTSRTLTLTEVAPWHDMKLEIRDENGKMVEPRLPPRALDWLSQPKFGTWPARATILLDGPANDLTAVSWIDISMWGYTTLSPGHYRITAVPRLEINEWGAEHFVATGDNMSNQVSIEVVSP
jgi:hypothetical protein